MDDIYIYVCVCVRVRAHIYVPLLQNHVITLVLSFFCVVCLDFFVVFSRIIVTVQQSFSLPEKLHKSH
jgi:hypothetical protein